jgi:hypothetical protein
MRLLLDECVPRPLKQDLVGHDVRHVSEMGWSSARSGELLRLMLADGFDALLTVDRSLGFQQNVRASGLGVVTRRDAEEAIGHAESILAFCGAELREPPRDSGAGPGDGGANRG